MLGGCGQPQSRSLFFLTTIIQITISSVLLFLIILIVAIFFLNLGIASNRIDKVRTIKITYILLYK